MRHRSLPQRLCRGPGRDGLLTSFPLLPIPRDQRHPQAASQRDVEGICPAQPQISRQLGPKLRQFGIHRDQPDDSEPLQESYSTSTWIGSPRAPRDRTSYLGQGKRWGCNDLLALYLRAEPETTRLVVEIR